MLSAALLDGASVHVARSCAEALDVTPLPLTSGAATPSDALADIFSRDLTTSPTLVPPVQAHIELPTLGEVAPLINLAINGALVAFLLYILLTARKGR